MRTARAAAYRQEVEAKIFACHLAELRSELGINQVDLARKLGITHGGVSRIEWSVDPKLSTLCKLASALGGTLHIEISVGERTVSLVHPSPVRAPSQPESDESAPPLPS